MRDASRHCFPPAGRKIMLLALVRACARWFARHHCCRHGQTEGEGPCASDVHISMCAAAGPLSSMAGG
jgi:hypothetical protein